jgi:hypothetical protein
VITLLAFIAGVVLGVVSRHSVGDVRYMIAKEEFEETVTVQGKEIARLRAQVALHIGKGKE